MQDYRKIRGDKKRSFWQEHITAWKKTPLTRNEYCQNHHLNLSTFQYWSTRFNKEQKNDTGLVPLTFDPPETKEPSKEPVLQLRLDDSLTLIIPDGIDQQHLTTVLQTLRRAL